MAESVLGSFVTGIGLSQIFSTLSETTKAGTTLVKWKALPLDWKKGVIASALDSLLDAEKDPTHGLSTKGMVDTIYDFIDNTIKFGFMIDESIANQLFIQMVQQSVAYAIHSSHAGSIGTVGNVYSGSMYLSGTESTQIAQNMDLLDRAERGFLSAEVGQNIPTLAFNLTRGANRRIDEVYSGIMRNIDSFLSEWNDLSLSYYRHYHTMCRARLQDAIEMKESIVNRAYGFLEQIANEHLARINEQLDTLEGAKAWFDSGWMDVNELKVMSEQVDVERQASEANYEEHEEAILNAIAEGISEWDNKISQALNDLGETEYRYSVLIKSIFDTLFADIVDFVTIICDMGDKAIEDVCAYRNMVQAVKIDVSTDLGVQEFSPEVEVYRLPMGKYKSIDPITIVSEYDRPRGLGWKSLDVEPEPPTATVIPRAKWKEVDYSIIVSSYDLVPETAWEDAS